ncbi:methionyl-tRNA formyltransferase [Sinosporangium album]|uniref:Methionyl-tRNA formyltransferase n=1 Tax=Sinosporangium album TaxID=504805 RepID=A0A1G8FE23_9ACTN|nr:formyltransferase family protein [Sinosporangium album]SDH80357.1 methionyl-tRNA formyltransferase [Sinosporangium album]
MTGLRVALVSFRSDVFAALHGGCVKNGNLPVVYINGRSGRPGGASYRNVGDKVTDILGGIPSDVDLLLPGNAEGLAQALRGYEIDVAVVCGLSWRLPKQVLEAPKLGILNVHASLLPQYRGPAPVQWAIRNGDPSIGMTVHWMNERIDTGRVVVQREGIELPEFLTFNELWPILAPTMEVLVAEALDHALDGYKGERQDETRVTYAGSMEPGFDRIDWARPARVIHNQVRAFYFGLGMLGPFAHVNGEKVLVQRTSLTEDEGGVRVECGDGPIWVVESRPVRGFSR